MLLSALGLEAHLPHQFLHCLVIDFYTFIMQLSSDAAVSVSALMLGIDSLDTMPYVIISVRLSKLFEIVVECGSCHLHPVQHELERMSFLP